MHLCTCAYWRCKTTPMLPSSVEQLPKMADGVACLAEDVDEHQQPLIEAVENAPTNQEEYEFIEQPSEEFFCPVTFELLLSPHQTTCCGHHLSEKAVQRLEREGKPCPMCKETKLVTMPDKFFKRKASAVLIRCPNKSRGCEWVGEVGGSNRHTCSCPKRAWECECCDFQSSFDVKDLHEGECSQYPVPCPNKCMVPVVVEDGMSASMTSTMIVRTIPRCEVEKHRAECPLELVTCEFVDVGCDVKTTRQDLKRHMEESQQQHLLTATLLNLKLTRETIVEKDRQLAEKDRQLTKRDNDIKMKDHQLIEMKQQLAEKEHQLADKDRQLAEKDHLLAEKELKLSQQDKKLSEVGDKKDYQLAEQGKLIFAKGSQVLEDLEQLHQNIVLNGQYASHRFTLEEFSECQKGGSYGSWYSDIFHCGGLKMQLNVETKERGSHMTIRLKPLDEIEKTINLVVALQLLNQQNSRGNFLRSFDIPIMKNRNYSDPYNYIEFKELYRRNQSVQYLKGDRLKFVLWIKIRQP